MTDDASGEGAAFETADDGLAAHLEVGGMRTTGVDLGLSADETDPAVAHVFDDDTFKVTEAVSRYQLGRGDDVSAPALISTYRRLRELREDERLRRRGQTRPGWAPELEEAREGEGR